MKNVHLLLLLLFVSCNKNRNDKIYESEDIYSEEGYSDGTYCAEIDYYYSETGTNSTYTLEVEIEDGELTVIHWPNGGWLDSTHFSPPDITDGEASFTSDKGVDYTVRIIGSDGDCSYDNHPVSEEELIDDNEDRMRKIQQDEEDEENRIRQEQEDEERQRQQEEEEEEERSRSNEE